MPQLLLELKVDHEHQALVAGDPITALLLLGLGNISSLSMDSHSIPIIKKMVRNITIEDARYISKKAMSLHSCKEINEFVNNEVTKMLPEEMNFNHSQIKPFPEKENNTILATN